MQNFDMIYQMLGMNTVSRNDIWYMYISCLDTFQIQRVYRLCLYHSENPCQAWLGDNDRAARVLFVIWTGHYSHYNTKLANSRYFHGNSCHIARTERGVAAILLLESYWALSLPPCLNNCNGMDGINDDIHSFNPYYARLVFGSNQLPWMTFGLECQLCSARGVSEAMTSQWFNLHTPFSNDAYVNNFPLFQARRHNSQWKPANTAHTCTDHNGNNARWELDFVTQTFCK